jgi:hypothetical protein
MNLKQIEKIYLQLNNYTSQNKLTKHEFSNLIHDLQEVVTRLEAGHYQHSDYISRNTFDIPRRTEEFLIYLQGYHQVAQTWTEILRPLISKDTQNVLDLCPGWAPKPEQSICGMLIPLLLKGF